MGFALYENAGYTVLYGIDVFFMRNILVSPGHMIYTAIAGALYGGLVWNSRESSQNRAHSILRYFAWTPSVILHALYNSMLTLPGMEIPGMTILFILFFDSLGLMILYRLVRQWRTRSPFRPYPLDQAAHAEKVISSALQSYPDSFVLNKRLGYYRLAQKKISAARPPLNRAVRLGPHSKITQLLCMASGILAADSSEVASDHLKRFNYLFNNCGDATRQRFIHTLIRLLPGVNPDDLGEEFADYFRNDADNSGWTGTGNNSTTGTRLAVKKTQYLSAPLQGMKARRIHSADNDEKQSKKQFKNQVEER